MNVPEAFDDFDDEQKLDPDERAAAQDRHNEITEILKDAGIATIGFLQGSFARKTMIPPLHDVDKVIILTEAYRDKHPDAVMDAMQTAVAAECSPATFERSRHALKIDITDDPFLFDTVPAFESDGDNDDITIANRDDGTWPSSNLRELTRVVAQRNQDTDGRFIHQVRMAKQAVRELFEDGLPGLHVEAVAFQAITNTVEHPDACAAIFDKGAALLGADYWEPTGVDKISARLDPAVVRDAQLMFSNAAEQAHEALLLAAAGDHDEAIRIWRMLFGEPFPSAPAQSANEAVERLARGGSITTAAAVSATRAGRQPVPATRSWRDA